MSRHWNHCRIHEKETSKGWLNLILIMFFFFVLGGCGKVSNVAEEAGIMAGDGAGELVILKETLDPVTAGAPYKEVITVDGGIRSFTFSLAEGSLFDGLLLDENLGIISGQVRQAEAGRKATVTIAVQDAGETRVTRSFELEVLPYAYSILPDTIPAIVPDMAYDFTLVAPGGAAPVRFTASGSLPPGLSLRDNGQLSTTSEGVSAAFKETEWDIDITAVDANGVQATRAYKIAVGPAVVIPPLEIRTETLANPSAGVEFAAAISVVGGVSPYAFSIQSGGLPQGMTIDATTGVISGTPELNTSGDPFVFTVRVVDAQGSLATQPLSGIVQSYTFTIMPFDIPVITPDTNFSFSLSTLGASGSVQYTVSGQLPTGLSMDATGRFVVSGTGVPSIYQNTDYPNIVVTARDANNVQVQRSYSISVGEAVIVPQLVMQTETLVNPTAGIYYLSNLAVTGGAPPYTFVVSTGSLPSGLSLNASTGIISGTAAWSTSGDSWSAIIQVTDSDGTNASRSFSGAVTSYSLVLGPSGLPAGIPEGSYQASLSVVGGDGPYTYAVAAGTSLPTGISIDSSTGVISGTFSAADAGQLRTFTLTATDAYGASVQRAYSINIANYQVTVTSASLNVATENQVYAGSLTATGGTAPYTWSYTGNLPNGVAITNYGVFQGTPAVGTGNIGGIPYAVSVRATDATGAISAARALTLSVGVSTPTISVGSLQDGARGAPYSHTLTASGGRSPYTFGLVSGNFNGLSLSSTGVISGSFTAEWTCPADGSVTVSLVDALGQAAASNVTFCITVTGGVSITTTSLPDPTAGSSYFANVAATGGVLPYSYSITIGSLPSGLSLDASTGVISGTPAWTTSGDDWLMIVQATDDNGATATQTYSGTVTAYTLTLTPSSLPDGSPEVAYQATLTASGGEGPYTYGVAAGSALPTGLSLNTSTGVISGTIAAAEAGQSTNVTLEAADVYGTEVQRAYTIEVSNYGVAVSTNSLTQATEGQAYSVSLSASGGSSPYAWEYTGSLPAGIAMTNTGTIVGIPASGTGSIAGTDYPIEVRATDSSGSFSATQSLTLTTGVSTPVISAGTSSTGVVDVSYSYILSASGGRSPYVYSLSAGSLPSGLSLSAAGVVSGVPSETWTCPGSGTFTVEVTDNLGQTDTESGLCIDIQNGIAITNVSLPTVVIGQAYSQTINAEGGSGNYSYSVSGLPTGLSLSTNTITGTAGGSATTADILVTVTDTTYTNLTASRTYSVVVATVLQLSGSTLDAGFAGRSYSESVSASGGTPPYTYAVASGNLPPGLSLSSGGTISGNLSHSAAANSPHAVGIQASDSAGQITATAEFSIAVYIPPSFRSTALTPARVGQVYTAIIDIAQGIPPFTFSSNDLTDLGFSVDATSGVVSSNSVAAATGNHFVNVTVTDSNSAQVTQTLSIYVVDNTATHTLSFAGARFSEICNPVGDADCGTVKPFDVGDLTGSGTKYVVWGNGVENDTDSWEILIAPISSAGRINVSAATVLTITTGFVSDLHLADFDNDGLLDIVFAAYNRDSSGTASRIQILWNDGTSGGNPSFSTGSVSTLPTGSGISTYAFTLKVAALDPSFPLAKDIIASIDWGPHSVGSTANFAVFPSACSTADCVGGGFTRDDIFTSGAELSSNLGTTTELDYGGYNIDVGNFYGDDNCPSIVVTGRADQLSDRPYLLFYNQGGAPGSCNKTFADMDVVRISTTANLMAAGIAVADFNDDNLDDIAITFARHDEVWVLKNRGDQGTNNPFATAPNYTDVTPDSRIPLHTRAHKVVPFCPNGTDSCTYPSLLIAMGLEHLDRSGNDYSGIVIAPNDGSGNFTELLSTNIYYSLPTGLRSKPVLTPIIGSSPTKNDLVILGASSDDYYTPYFAVLENNYADEDNPFKQLEQLKSFAEGFDTADDVGRVIVRDIDGDGDSDVVSHVAEASSLAVQLNDGTGGLSTTYNFPTRVQHAFPYFHIQKSMASADFNNDGLEDFVVAGYNDDSISVLLGDSSDILSEPVIYAAGGVDIRPIGVVVGDINMDGRQDVVLLSMEAGTSPKLSWYQGNGDGTFQASAALVTGSTAIGCADPRTLDLIDLDGDRKNEIAILCGRYGYLYVFRRFDGSGNWVRNGGSAATTGDSNLYANSMAFGQFTPADNCVDLAESCIDVLIATDEEASSVVVMKNLTLTNVNEGSESFGLSINGKTSVNLNGQASDIVVGDFNYDGFLDAAVSMWTQNNKTYNSYFSYPHYAYVNGSVFYLLEGNGSGSFTSTGWGLQTIGATGIAAGYIDNDGLLDLVHGFRYANYLPGGTRIPYRNISRYLNLSTTVIP